MTIPITSTKILYEQDYCKWIQTTIEKLKIRQIEGIDWANLIEELTAMGRSEKKALLSNLRILLMHLLKWKYQPSKRTNSWDFTIAEHRNRLEDDFKTSPSLKPYFLESLDECYEKAIKLAAKETGLSLDTFPVTCPFTSEQILNSDYLPE
ncbi:DUF29 domain-containing protein [Crocosphaera sp. UHCC 0190]|uniref:DUF29 domain-containing protein n=1 Tax=Crocosphaera sp. UHCC 0190 TaxID=3110246 RepID=UPI002B1FE905|nr:DUF29 domain-containing protein [Crocosphaera sp. UHCC 0190]MEA5511890.1 DUF29 domain-containing protein [Crocosphaera sp. UHCC 0190]